MVVSEATLYEHLHKLVAVKSEQELESLLQLLWRTRKTGLSDPERSSLQSLLKLPLRGDIDPVLASLRSLIRSCVHENMVSDDILKLLPPDLSLELQSMLLISLQTLERQWKTEMSQEQHSIGGSRFSHQNNPGPSAPLLPFSPSDFSGSLLSLQADPVFQFNGHNFGVPTPIMAERDVCFPQLSLQNDAAPLEIPGVLPRVKSMTWTVENKGLNLMPANRVAIITLKLQDYTKSPSNEMEVKFQLTKDTLEAVLRSMRYISEQLSRYVGSSPAPLHKKQKL